MASSTRACAINKCEIFSCAVCHCCQHDLYLDHLKEHKDQLNTQLTPLANQINTFLDALEHFAPTSSPSFKILDQWRIAAHETVERFYERMCNELFEQKKNKPLEKLRTTRDRLDQLIRKQGATRENIDSLSNDIRLIEEEINGLQNIQISLQPLVIDDNAIVQSASSNRTQQPTWYNASLQPASGGQNGIEPLENETNFQIFVELYTSERIFIMVASSDTIMELKRKIEDKTGIPVDQQHLTYMGKQLQDRYSIATYDIQRHITINLRLTLKH